MKLPSGFRSKGEDGMVWRSRAPLPGWLLLAVMVIVLCSYFLYMPRQRDVESRFASMLLRRLQWYALDNPGITITNLGQVLNDTNRGYPYEWHDWLRNYGEDAGFTRSLEEKFVVVSPGVDFRGQIFLLSAVPYTEGNLQVRTIITRNGNDFGYDYTSERFVQEAFRKAGKTIPTAPVATPPPPPQASRESEMRAPTARHYYLSAWLETRGQFSQLEWKGFSPRAARFIEKCVAISSIVAALAIAGYCLWPLRIAREEGESDALLPMTTKGKLWALFGATFGFILVSGVLLPSFGSDRGLGQLYGYLLFPYTMAAESMRGRGDLAGFLFFVQILCYDYVLGWAWIKNRLGRAAIVLAIIHIYAIAFAVYAQVKRFS